MTTDELRDELARMAGVEFVRYPVAWKFQDGTITFNNPIPSTLDGLVEIWGDGWYFSLFRYDGGPHKGQWECNNGGTFHKCPVDAVLSTLAGIVRDFKEDAPTAYAAWQRKVQEQAR
jgi:hypothetical protein